MTKSNVSINHRTECRLCGSSKLHKFLSFEDIPFFDEVVRNNTKDFGFKYPMDIYVCTECSSVQSQHDVSLDSYYSNYSYTASSSSFVRAYMNELVEYIISEFSLSPGSTAIEVGCADGYLLSLFKEKGLNVLGFEGALNLCHKASALGVQVENKIFTEDTLSLGNKYTIKSVDLMILLHTFDHLHDPCEFLQAVVSALEPNKGILLLEVHDFNDIYHKKETALFGHEHSTFLDYFTMKKLLSSFDLKIIDYNFIDKSKMRGSSMLIAAAFNSSAYEEFIPQDLSDSESMRSVLGLDAFAHEVKGAFKQLLTHVQSLRSKGYRVSGYGGWGRGVTTMAMAHLSTAELDCVYDKNPELDGCFTPSTGIPIKTPSTLSKSVCDVLIVFNYAYMAEIKHDLSAFLADGGSIISVMDLLSS